ncbi:MAG: PKD domain-containing protein [Saprospiraceae bacterium]|nr:PKD domain-containing protein [Saprospiraceae bacterium]MCF8249266.1 PKD domain-containing protein [Saprospiraceae bacterium]MCF8281166.1 PKD domain-containing protein [Bacteroidales bacterium]MCF8311457.1 PKD domain-containing protein [Saprospiraceae bacterium]MCF8439885.1 PKD domain-containing protein [Saprospiraceae bacterium]
MPLDFESNGLGYYIPKLFYSIIDINLNNGLGEVIEKDVEIIADTLAVGKLTACKHANGRDWWILVPENDKSNNGIYKLLLTPDGISVVEKEEIPAQLYNVSSVGNAIFTPDGSKYIRQDIRFDPWNVVTIYDFNRCTGGLALLEQFEINDTSFLYGGAAVSPDSKYLYCVTNKIIYQFNLTATNIEATKTVVAEYDGFVGLFFQTLFGTPQLAPDGSIWIASTSDTTMHVIRTPNQPGTACQVDQHSIHLPKVNQKSIPNFPNFRLGPLDGSPCDTLGLDNNPLAGFTWWPDELAVTFSDNSYYRPETWAWDFGEPTGSSGNTSTERNPLHSYDTPGEYYVCLIVSNEYDSDTICHWVQVDTLMTMVDVTALPDSPVNGVAVNPNPASEHVSITLRYPLAKPGEWVLYSVVGEKVLSKAIPVGTAAVREVSVVGLPPGLYFWRLSTSGALAATGKLVILK